MSDESQGAGFSHHGDAARLASISRRIVALHKAHYGRGPTKAKTYHNDDLIVVLMRGGFTKAEETLREGGRGDLVIQHRADLQEVMIDRFKQVVEEETGHKVAAQMSNSHQQPDLICEIFVLEPNDLLGEETSGQPGPGGTG